MAASVTQAAALGEGPSARRPLSAMLTGAGHTCLQGAPGQGSDAGPRPPGARRFQSPLSVERPRAAPGVGEGVCRRQTPRVSPDLFTAGLRARGFGSAVLADNPVFMYRPPGRHRISVTPLLQTAETSPEGMLPPLPSCHSEREKANSFLGPFLLDVSLRKELCLSSSLFGTRSGLRE